MKCNRKNSPLVYSKLRQIEIQCYGSKNIRQSISLQKVSMFGLKKSIQDPAITNAPIFPALLTSEAAAEFSHLFGWSFQKDSPCFGNQLPKPIAKFSKFRHFNFCLKN
jgi:hypothetical protein